MRTALLSMFDWAQSHFETPPSFVAPARLASGLAGDNPVGIRNLVEEIFRRQGNYLVWTISPATLQDEAENSWGNNVAE